MGRKRERECGRRDGGVGGWKGNRLVREIEKECEGMWVLWVIEGVQEEKQKREIVQIADRGSWQTGAKTNPAKDSVLWSILSLSRSFFYMALQRLQRLEGNGSNNCTGNYSIKHPIHPRLAISLSFFSLSSLQSVEAAEALRGKGEGGGPRAVWAGHSMIRSSGWTRRHLAGGRRDCEQTLRECCGGLGLSSWVYAKTEQQPHLTSSHTLTLRQDKLFLDLNRKRKKDGDKNKKELICCCQISFERGSALRCNI